MIEINLLPEELKSKKAKNSPDLLYILYLIPLIGVILLFIHLSLGILYFYRGYSLNSLNNKWKVLEPQRKKLAELKNESDSLSSEARIAKQFSDQAVKWAPKLNKLSLFLPSGIWFNEIIVDKKNFVLKGTVVSLKEDQVDLINKFLEGLKNDKQFFSDFNDLEMGAVQRKTIGSFEVSDFVLSGDFKTK